MKNKIDLEKLEKSVLGNKQTSEEYYAEWVASGRQFIPTMKRVVIRQDNVEIVSSGGIIMNVDTRNHRKPQTGTVIAVAPDCEVYKPGNKVFFSQYAGINLHYPEPDALILMSEREVFGRFKNKNAKLVVGNTLDAENLVDEISDTYTKQHGAADQE